MKAIQTNTELLQSLPEEEQHVYQLATGGDGCEMMSVMGQNSASESTFASSDASTVDTSFDGWDYDVRNDELSKTAGQAALEQMELFDSYSSLTDTDEMPTVAELSWDDLEVGELLGTGGFSSVYQVSILPEPESYALKFLNKKIWHQDSERVSIAASDLAMEAKLLSHLHHPNIIKLHGTSSGCPSASFQQKGGLFLVLDLLEDTLHERIAEWKTTKYSSLLHRLKTTAVQVVKGMEYLHKNNIVFRDLKPQNIGRCGLTGQVKIFDFGLACELDQGEQLTSPVGTPRWMAPEVALGKSYGLSCDVHSFGIVLWQLCSLKRPFDRKFKTMEELFRHVAVKKQRPSLSTIKCPRSLKSLIKSCWHPDPKRRPSFKTIAWRLDEIISTM